MEEYELAIASQRKNYTAQVCSLNAREIQGSKVEQLWYFYKNVLEETIIDTEK